MPHLIPTPQEVDVRLAIDRIAAFAASAQPEHVRSDIRQLFKRNILDSLGCAIAGLQLTFRKLRGCTTSREHPRDGRCLRQTVETSALNAMNSRTMESLADWWPAPQDPHIPAKNYLCLIFTNPERLLPEVGGLNLGRTWLTIDDLCTENNFHVLFVARYLRQALKLGKID